MSPRFDIQFDEDNDLEIINEDLVWDVSDEQHIEDTINAFPGYWQENFSDGVGVVSFQNSDGQEQILARLLKLELESDLYTVDNPKISFDTAGNLVIQPNAS